MLIIRITRKKEEKQVVLYENETLFVCFDDGIVFTSEVHSKETLVSFSFVDHSPVYKLNQNHFLTPTQTASSHRLSFGNSLVVFWEVSEPLLMKSKTRLSEEENKTLCASGFRICEKSPDAFCLLVDTVCFKNTYKTVYALVNNVPLANKEDFVKSIRTKKIEGLLVRSQLQIPKNLLALYKSNEFYCGKAFPLKDRRKLLFKDKSFVFLQKAVQKAYAPFVLLCGGELAGEDFVGWKQFCLVWQDGVEEAVNKKIALLKNGYSFCTPQHLVAFIVNDSETVSLKFYEKYSEHLKPSGEFLVQRVDEQKTAPVSLIDRKKPKRFVKNKNAERARTREFDRFVPFKDD